MTERCAVSEAQPGPAVESGTVILQLHTRQLTTEYMHVLGCNHVGMRTGEGSVGHNGAPRRAVLARGNEGVDAKAAQAGPGPTRRESISRTV